MNRAERRAREKWRASTSDPIETAALRLSDLADCIMKLHRTTDAVAAKFEGGLGNSHELEAVTRWAVAAGSAYARAADDLRRLDARLKLIANFTDPEKEPAA